MVFYCGYSMNVVISIFKWFYSFLWSTVKTWHIHSCYWPVIVWRHYWTTLFQPDLSDWFLIPGNRLLLTLVHLFALVAIGVLGVAVLSRRRVSTLFQAWYVLLPRTIRKFWNCPFKIAWHTPSNNIKYFSYQLQLYKLNVWVIRGFLDQTTDN